MNLIVKPDRASGLTLIVLALALAAFVVANQRVGTLKRDAINPEFSVRLPVPAQIVMAVGDRHLAADLAEFRVLVADTFRMRPEDYALQAGLQRDIAFLNPAHEDNYYIAAAILPWGGQLDAAQYVLKQLRSFKNNLRNVAIMHGVAGGLQGAEMDAVAAYLQSLGS